MSNAIIVEPVIDDTQYDSDGNEIDIDDERHVLTVAKMQKFMPKGMDKQVTQAVVDQVNDVSENFGIGADFFKEKVLAYSHLVGGKGMTIKSLMNAIKYVHFRGISAMTNERAYELTFPENYERLVAEDRFIASYVSAYNGSKMVTEVQRLLIVEVGIACAPVHMAMIQKQVDLANGIGANPHDRVSPTVQQIAAAKAADLTKMPEKTEHSVEVSVNTKGSIIDEYEKAISMMANAKMKEIDNGSDVLETLNAPVRAIDPDEIVIEDVKFDAGIHDIDVYTKYGIVVERK